MKNSMILAVVALAGSAASAQVLYSNGNLNTGPTLLATGLSAPAGTTWAEVGYLGTTPETPGNSAGRRVLTGTDRLADDFTVPAGQSWDITAINLFNYQTGASTLSPTITGATLRILSGNPMLGVPTVVFGDTTTNRLASSTFSTMYRVFASYANVNGFGCASAFGTSRPIYINRVNAVVTLGPGTYWLDWSLSGTLASGPWQPALYAYGAPTFGTPGANGLQGTAGLVYTAYTETGLSMPCAAGFFADPQDFPFEVLGDSGGCAPDLTTGAVPGQPGYGVPNGILNNDDFFYFLAQFAAGNLAVADVTTGAVPGQPGYGVPNGVINNDDFFYYLAIFAAGC